MDETHDTPQRKNPPSRRSAEIFTGADDEVSTWDADLAPQMAAQLVEVDGTLLPRARRRTSRSQQCRGTNPLENSPRSGCSGTCWWILFR